MIEPEKKKMYQLWWEYLKRSKKYKMFIEWCKMEDRGPLPDKLKAYHEPMFNTYLNFGDVHANNFNKWWKEAANSPLPDVLSPYYSEFGKCIVNYRDVVGKDVYKLLGTFRKINKRDPSKAELAAKFKTHMDNWKDSRLYLLIEFQHKSTDELVEEFKALLKNHKKMPSVKKQYIQTRGLIQLTTSRRPIEKELRRYLETYDLKEKDLSDLDIAKRIRNDLPSDYNGVITLDHTHYIEDLKRIIRRDLQKAKKIIDNVENGYFPGEYD